MREKVIISAMVILLAVADYFLFREYELVWPFFLLPYLVFLISYIVFCLKPFRSRILFHAVSFFVIIPVLAGLSMSIGWMIKIDFAGEMIRRLLYP